MDLQKARIFSCKFFSKNILTLFRFNKTGINYRLFPVLTNSGEGNSAVTVLLLQRELISLDRVIITLQLITVLDKCDELFLRRKMMKPACSCGGNCCNQPTSHFWEATLYSGIKGTMIGVFFT